MFSFLFIFLLQQTIFLHTDCVSKLKLFIALWPCYWFEQEFIFRGRAIACVTKLTDKNHGGRVLDASAHILSHALTSQSALEISYIKYSITSRVKQAPFAYLRAICLLATQFTCWLLTGKTPDELKWNSCWTKWHWRGFLSHFFGGPY
jgi:hypothetical protein